LLSHENMSSGASAASRSPTITVVTPAYNAAAFLTDAVESVLRQSFQCFELIIIDDGSTDETGDIARRLAATDERVRVLATRNGGQAAARNLAIRSARGEFITLLDSDDMLAPTYLARQLALFRAHPDVGVITVNAVNRGGGAAYDGQTIWPRRSGQDLLTLHDLIEHENAVCIMSIFRREVFDRLDGFNAALPRNEDYEFWLRAALAGCTFLRNYEPHALYRRRDDSLSADEAKMIQGVLGVLRRIDPLLVARPRERGTLRRQVARFTRELQRVELRSSLERSDALAAARVFRTLAAERHSWLLALCARLTSCWPQPLLWAYRLRRKLRPA
jgi:glycosyltransferase involved in cell wall biosynthesis